MEDEGGQFDFQIKWSKKFRNVNSVKGNASL